jgi:redox-sensing transcriptional repressor
MVSDGPRRAVPDAAVARLPVYHRCLLDLDARGRETVSSEQLAELAGVNAAMVRKDLSLFGTYGTRGVGYHVADLIVDLRRELGLTSSWPCVIVGAGNLGSALAAFGGFAERGFEVVGVVDIDPQRIGQRIASLVVAHQNDLDRIVADHGVLIGVIAVPPGAAQDAADRLVASGVRSLLNFAPTVIDVPDDVGVRNVDLAVELQILAFHEGRRDATPVDAASPTDDEVESLAGPPVGVATDALEESATA